LDTQEGNRKVFIIEQGIHAIESSGRPTKEAILKEQT